MPLSIDELKNIDAKNIFAPEEIAFLKNTFDTEEFRNAPHAEWNNPDWTFSDKVFYWAFGITEDYTRMKNGTYEPPDEEKAILSNPLAETIVKKVNSIDNSIFPGEEESKQLTLKRIKNIEDNYFSKTDADTLKQEIADNDSVAKTDTILVSQGEIKLFENAEAFEFYKQKIKKTFDITLNENVDYTILEEDYYLRTTVSSGGYKAGSNLITESNLPTKVYSISYRTSNVSDITTGAPPGIDSMGRIPLPPWYWFRVNADQAQTRINVYKPFGGSGGSTTFKINDTGSQTEFQPNYLNIFAVKFLKTLTYKTFFINSTKEQTEEFKQTLPIVKAAIKDYVVNVKVKPKILYIKGQQYVFSNRQAFNDIFDKLVILADDKDSFEIDVVTLDDFEIKNIENSEEIKIIPKKNMYWGAS